MALTPTVYRSTDPGAPAMTGQAGSLRDVLRAVLVTGFGSGSTAKAGAGWTEPHSGTNVSAFRNSPVTGTGGLLRVDDSATFAGTNARNCLFRAFGAMTDVNTGTDPAPTTAQYAQGLLTPKSRTLDSVARAWTIVANERCFYLFTDPGATDAAWVNVPHFPLFAGDILTRKPGDGFHFALIGAQMGPISGLGNSTTGMFYGLRYSASSISSTGVYLLRSASQASGARSAALSCLTDGEVNAMLGGSGSYPDPISGGLRMERIAVIEGQYQIRGYLPGVYGTSCGMPFAAGAVRTDIEGVPAGTQILSQWISQTVGGSSSNLARCTLLIDITNAWT